MNGAKNFPVPFRRTVPFSEILQRLADDALRSAGLPRGIEQPFASYLQQRLAAVLGQCLYLHFHARRLTFSIVHGSRRGCYRAFISDLQERGIEQALASTPLALEAMRTVTARTVENAQTFLSHLHEDSNAISQLLGSAGSAAPLAISVGWSDPHRGGKTVIRIDFPDGSFVFYKPRSMRIDQVWFDGLARLQDGNSFHLRAPRVLDRGDHGWSEGIAPVIEMSHAEASDCCGAFGATLCLAWLLDALDLHRDNFIISRGQPILVDPECLLHPVRGAEFQSLSSTLMIPDAAHPWDVSALGQTTEQVGFPELSWHGLGTDDLNMTLDPVTIPPSNHLPTVGGAGLPRHVIATAVQSGFRKMSRYLRCQTQLIEDWRAELHLAERRVLYRSTIYYDYVQRRAAHPASLASADAWNMEVTTLLGRLLPTEVLNNELRQLQQWDVPIFQSSEGELAPARWNNLDKQADGIYNSLAT